MDTPTHPQGLRKCTWQQAVYKGDPLLSPITSYEVPVLVHALVHASEVLNTWLRLGDAADTTARSEVPETFVQAWLVRARNRGARINLRPWADVRNLMGALVLGMLAHYSFLMIRSLGRAIVYFSELEID